ncbi:hypothetical protein FQA39_LY05384 [Lamprigera yunnana]|nr:hypothetical protein FQA39_LY05384 [Lamprigera yunnana]
MESHDGINARDLEDDDRQIDLTIIPPSPDYVTNLDDIDEDNMQSDVLPADVTDEIEVFTNDSEYDSDDNLPLAYAKCIGSQCLETAFID